MDVFEQYLDEDTTANPTIGIFSILDTSHNQPLDHWYRQNYNVEKDVIAYTIMKSEVETIISQMTLETKLKLSEFERGGVPLPMSYGARWWAGTTFKGKFYHWTKCSQMPFHIYAQIKPKLELIDEYMEDRGLMYLVEVE